DLLAETLAVLAAPDRPPRACTLRVFELRLLDALGFAPVLDRCTSCGRADLGGEGMRFDLPRGGVTCGHCHRVRPDLSPRAPRPGARGPWPPPRHPRSPPPREERRPAGAPCPRPSSISPAAPGARPNSWRRSSQGGVGPRTAPPEGGGGFRPPLERSHEPE